MKSRIGWRARLGAFGTILALGVTGLFVASPSARAIEQNGPRNYVGTGQCPIDATDCLITSADVTVIQTQTDPDPLGLGRYNKVVASAPGQDADATQCAHGKPATGNGCDEASNSTPGVASSVECRQSTSGAGTLTTAETLTCIATQVGDGGNVVRANMRANPSTNTTVGGNITQNNALKLIVNQTSVSGNNTVTGIDPTGTNPEPDAKLTSTQTARQEVATNLDVTHTQKSFEVAAIRQNAAGDGDNAVTLTLNRTQDSFTRGATPTQLQDTTVDPSATQDLCANPGRNGNACLFQRTNEGTQSATIRAKDVKTATAQNVPLGNVSTQQQGPAEAQGGWLTEVDMDSEGNPEGGTVDLGESCLPTTRTDCSDTAGIGKQWTLSATDIFGQPVGGASSQNDGILDNLIGKSPCSGDATGWAKLVGRVKSGADPGTMQVANLDAVGHTKCPAGWSGSISAQLNDFGKRVNHGGQNVSAHIGCNDTADNVNTNCSNITASPATFSAVEGNSSTGTIATFTDDNPDDTAGLFTATIDWGDESTSTGTVSGGSGNFTVAGTHTYADDGSYPVTVKIFRGTAHVGTANSTADVTNAALAATGKTVDAVLGAQFNGAVASFTNGNPDEDAAIHEATIDWGDNTPTSSGSIAPNGTGFDVSGTHKYTTNGTYTIKTTITEPDGTTATASSPVTLSIAQCPAGGCFIIGNRAAGLTDTSKSVYFWGNDWAANNPMSPGGAVSSSFKGFGNNSAPSCSAPGNTWTSSGGTSPPPSGSLPSAMLVVVTSQVKKAGSGISGNVVKVVVVEPGTNPPYSPNSGGVGTGKVIATVCG